MLKTQTSSVNETERLLETVNQALSSWVTYAPYLIGFRRRLQRSRTAPEAEVSADVITMNSRFALRDAHTGETICYTLVYPEDEAPQDGQLSVLSPLGMALYGAKVGEEVCWMSAAGPQVATVTNVLYQPEAAGDRRESMSAA
jgi:regulator of nucleoside diphosphate kinase